MSKTDNAEAADALVLLGATGDLAHKMIFPALYAMVKRGALTVPVIGVPHSDWDRHRRSLARFGASEARLHSSTFALVGPGCARAA